jgi:hypothetical protein
MRYVIGGTTSADVKSLLTSDEILGHTMIVHDSEGGRVACGVVGVAVPAPAPDDGGGDDDDDDGCRLPLHSPPNMTECEDLQEDDCSDGLVNYLSLYYCQLGYTPPNEAGGKSPRWAHATLWKGVALVTILLWLFVLVSGPLCVPPCGACGASGL